MEETHMTEGAGAVREFTGIFDDEIRSMLRMKRKSLGLTYDSMADFIGVQWSTYRKWELGPTSKCGFRHTSALNAFLHGQYDNMLTSSKKRAAKKDLEAEQLLNYLRLTRSLISDSPSLKQDFDNRLQAILTETVHAIVSA